MSLHPRLVALSVLVCSLTAGAAPKITIAPISGDKKSQVQSQNLGSALPHVHLRAFQPRLHQEEA